MVSATVHTSRLCHFSKRKKWFSANVYRHEIDFCVIILMGKCRYILKMGATRDHEPWPGGESRKRDCLRRLPSPPEGLAHSPFPIPRSPLASAFAGCDAPHPALQAFAARQATNAAFAAHECACFAGYTNGEWGTGKRDCGAKPL